MEQQAPEWSLGAIAGTLGTIALALAAALGLYIDGVVLIYVGLIQPGGVTVYAVAYVALVILVPVSLGRGLRGRGSGWRATIAAVSAVIVAISLLFLPVVLVAFSM